MTQEPELSMISSAKIQKKPRNDSEDIYSTKLLQDGIKWFEYADFFPLCTKFFFLC